jgi:hypothetical protein
MRAGSSRKVKLDDGRQREEPHPGVEAADQDALPAACADRGQLGVDGAQDGSAAGRRGTDPNDSTS